jgi:hypothetical protein
VPGCATPGSRAATSTSARTRSPGLGSGTDIIILKYFRQKKLAKILEFFAQTTATFSKILIMTLVSEKNDNLFRRKLAKIAENCDHNIDP